MWHLVIALLPLAAMTLVVWVRPPLVATVRQPVGVGQPPVQVPPAGVVSQEFVASGDRIDAVSVMIANPLDSTGTVTMAISPRAVSDDPPAPADTTAQLGSISDWQNVVLRVPTLPTVIGERYVLSVRSPAGIWLAATPRDAYRQGVASTDGKPLEGDLIFRVHRDMVFADLTREANGLPVWVALAAIAGAAGLFGRASAMLVTPLHAGETEFADSEGDAE